MEAGRIAAGSGRQAGAPQRASVADAPARLDPFSLPVRFEAADDAADGRRRIVELHRERVVLRRTLNGMRMALNMPVTAFRGVALKFPADAGGAPEAGAVVLEHADPALSLPLTAPAEAGDIIAEWQAWARVLGLPLLVVDIDGCREPFARIGALRVAPQTLRRRRRTAVARRHPSRLLRRRAGTPAAEPTVHRDEREIIARD